MIIQYLEDNFHIEVSAEGSKSIVPDGPHEVAKYLLEPPDVELRHGRAGHDWAATGAQTAADDHRVRAFSQGGQGADVVHSEETTAGKR